MKQSEIVKSKKGYVYIHTFFKKENCPKTGGGGGAGCISSTIVFKSNKKGPISDKYLDYESYATLKQALDGHKRMVAKWKEKG